jgi:hypothetical protein
MHVVVAFFELGWQISRMNPDLFRAAVVERVILFNGCGTKVDFADIEILGCSRTSW